MIAAIPYKLKSQVPIRPLTYTYTDGPDPVYVSSETKALRLRVEYAVFEQWISYELQAQVINLGGFLFETELAFTLWLHGERNSEEFQVAIPIPDDIDIDKDGNMSIEEQLSWWQKTLKFIRF